MSQQIPLNKKLYDMIVAQAKAKYANYPNPGASHWVHSTYVKYGGKFGDAGEIRKYMELSKQFQEKRRAAMKKKGKEHEKDDKGGKKKNEDN